VSTERSRGLAHQYAPEILNRHAQQLAAYKRMDLDDLFVIQEVRVDVSACDMPGPTRFKAICQQCGQTVRDKREVMKDGQVLCRPCAFGTYYQPVTKQSRKNDSVSPI
jgi:formylmethanofuran dehydrogenase subunit E